MHSILKVAGVVHIWYYIPLCTIFAQQFNSDLFRTKFNDSKSRSQNPTPISKEDSSDHQSGNPWQLSEDYSRTPTTWLCRSWVGNYFRIIPMAIVTGALMEARVAWHSGIKNSLGGLQKMIRNIMEYIS
ncbi:hypothetical protein O181_127032 [Austropuccinia psidii MF-1]|uniref:Uncharacterized protein n=1 Tax=Austropuccinia psidii MF-1 TaxID=1389203 RepID=A0A9Q3Q930_9BASI|nr:hypothetical protein [Austropuccinia psidii MF-1]